MEMLISHRLCENIIMDYLEPISLSICIIPSRCNLSIPSHHINFSWCSGPLRPFTFCLLIALTTSCLASLVGFRWLIFRGEWNYGIPLPAFVASYCQYYCEWWIGFVIVLGRLKPSFLETVSSRDLRRRLWSKLVPLLPTNWDLLSEPWNKFSCGMF